MLNVLLLRDRRRFCRVGVDFSLSGDHSLLRAWCACGRWGRSAVVWFSNPCEAGLPAEGWARQARRRGKDMETGTA